MYFWNLNKLKTELKEGPLPEYESFKYIFATAISYAIGNFIMSLDNVNYSFSFAFIVFICEIIVTIVGIKYIYIQNGGHNGKNFVQKYIAMSWVVGIRFLAFSIISLILLYILLSYVVGAFLSSIIIGVLYTSIYYYFVGKNIKDTV